MGMIRSASTARDRYEEEITHNNSFDPPSAPLATLDAKEKTKKTEVSSRMQPLRLPLSAPPIRQVPSTLGTNQKFVPGTEMKRTNNTRASTWKSTKAINALFMISFRTYGSLIFDQFMKVYSL